ncbi:SH3 domain-containing protein [Treponema sp. OMZ 840]|uniref:SH3 domain-containing protein n=1 Tax=Treponema sp. OMZ 840 TaxID=244313 RepID=UPI003D931434
MKPLYYILLFLLSVIQLSALDINGFWVSESQYRKMVNSDYFSDITDCNYIHHDVYGFTVTGCFESDGLIIKYDEKKQEGFFNYHSEHDEKIFKKAENSSKIIFDTVYTRPLDEYRGSMEIVKVGTNKIIIKFDPPGYFENESPFIRISSESTMEKINAIVNDSRVRIRTEPNLNADVWGYMNKNYKVVIKDKSAEAFTIDNETWYWYKVESKNYPDGWVYGKYLDIEEGNEGEADKGAQAF